tara:strand:+ start:99 stop:605 length:507 start_codon:yes stop_codon:yes gene_type:complete
MPTFSSLKSPLFTTIRNRPRSRCCGFFEEEEEDFKEDKERVKLLLKLFFEEFRVIIVIVIVINRYRIKTFLCRIMWRKCARSEKRRKSAENESAQVLLQREEKSREEESTLYIYKQQAYIIIIYFTGENGAALHNVVLKCVTIGAIFPMVSRQASAVLAASLTLMCDW